ncbi:response regulator transcription factor [Streptomyces sp. NPDC002659]|uniref:response regulator transcription factor n=1 Tax=Streptomyces sp. NPDC002659 TaxID=3364656 RepID=UPI00368210B8
MTKKKSAPSRSGEPSGLCAWCGRSTSDQLSLREREIVLLVVQGLSDREVAEQLTLSVRTVSNRLYHIYRKLGITNRRELQRGITPPQRNHPFLRS